MSISGGSANSVFAWRQPHTIRSRPFFFSTKKGDTKAAASWMGSTRPEAARSAMKARFVSREPRSTTSSYRPTSKGWSRSARRTSG
eukprot:8190337-Lingulodinium_polyedra.AAC.1